MLQNKPQVYIAYVGLGKGVIKKGRTVQHRIYIEMKQIADNRNLRWKNEQFQTKSWEKYLFYTNSILMVWLNSSRHVFNINLPLTWKRLIIGIYYRKFINILLNMFLDIFVSTNNLFLSLIVNKVFLSLKYSLYDWMLIDVIWNIFHLLHFTVVNINTKTTAMFIVVRWIKGANISNKTNRNTTKCLFAEWCTT